MTTRELSIGPNIDLPDSAVDKSFGNLNDSIDLLGETANRIADQLVIERQKTKRLRAANRALVKALIQLTIHTRPGSPAQRVVDQALKVNAEVDL